MQLFPWNPTELLPHRPPMLLIDEIIDWGAQHASAALTIRPDTLFLEGDRVPAHIGIEYMAQTCGAWAGAVARESGLAPRRGYLLGDDFTAADVMVGYALHLGALMGLVAAAPADIQSYWKRLQERPAYQRAAAV